MKKSIFIGFDPRETAAFAVTRTSLLNHLKMNDPLSYNTHGIILSEMKNRGLYTRKTISKGPAKLWDVISESPMATEFAISRFLTPLLAKKGWALFMDCDMLIREDINHLFDLADPTKALMCVHHNHVPKATVKMDNQVQTVYTRKNWSSVMLFNCDHPANQALTVDLINKVPGRDLHRFCWLKDEEIGELPVEWNWLAGYSDPNIQPKLVHFTDGDPSMLGYEKSSYAEEWFLTLNSWAREC